VTFSSGNGIDFTWTCYLKEGFWVGMSLSDEENDGALNAGDSVDRDACRLSSGWLDKEAFNGAKPIRARLTYHAASLDSKNLNTLIYSPNTSNYKRNMFITRQVLYNTDFLA
jgi:hypothetical protein